MALAGGGAGEGGGNNQETLGVDLRHVTVSSDHPSSSPEDNFASRKDCEEIFRIKRRRRILGKQLSRVRLHLLCFPTSGWWLMKSPTYSLSLTGSDFN